MAVRNFWIEAQIDGQKTLVAGGPRNIGGGLDLKVFVRNEGGIENAVTINCIADRDGKLHVVVAASEDEGVSNQVAHVIRNR